MKLNIEKLQNGRIFNITFVKKNGELRQFNARFGVRKHLKGGQMTYNPSDHNYIVVFSLNDNGYRTINVNNITRVAANGNIYTRIS
jgi:hypothetical protein